MQAYIIFSLSRSKRPRVSLLYGRALPRIPKMPPRVFRCVGMVTSVPVLLFGIHLDFSTAFHLEAMLAGRRAVHAPHAPMSSRRAAGHGISAMRPMRTGRAIELQPLQALALEEAGDVSSLEEGMAVNELEHREECEYSERTYELKLGEHVHPNIACPPLQPFPAAVSLPGPAGSTGPVELLKLSDGPLFTADECNAIVKEAEQRKEWVIDGDWHKDQDFPGIDLPVEKLPKAMEFLQTAMPCRLFPFLTAALPELCADPANLRISDLFLVKYNEKLGQTSLRQHQDKGLISVNLALNAASEYEDGGTYIPALGRVAKIEQGQCLAHSSSLWHAGNPITAGTRIILVCFLVSTVAVEHKRRFVERAALLRNKGKDA
jgi:hypothetical protein